MKAVIHADLFDLDGYREDRYLIFDDIIRETGPMSACPSFALSPSGPWHITERVDLRGAFTMPGLVNAHSHLYSAFARGMRFDWRPDSFREILEQLWWRLDRCIDPETARLSALTLGLEQLKAGITTTIDHHASGVSIPGTLDGIREALCDTLGVRAVLCFESSDRFPLEACIRENLRFLATTTPGISAGMFGLHASLTLSDASLARIAETRGTTPVHVHVAESVEDESDSLASSGLRTLARLDRFGLLDAGTLAAHCTNIDESEAEILSARGCTVAACVASNMNNAVGLPDLRMLRRYHIPVVIGNDSLGTDIARDYATTLHAMHLKDGNPYEYGYPQLADSLREGWQVAGRRLGLPLGRLEPGCPADFIAYRYRPPTPIHTDNAAGHLFGGIFPALRPEEVWARGVRRIHNGMSDLDEDGIAAEARECARRLWERMGL